ncbi:methyltransferase [Bradyrhizobium sp. LHD-71]|uniref:methyltransferase n=1 Tax=Bradyrhizobium sp. LHD-71 TaxID=3072141 RepID=UPI00280CB046|nr:methyltransferase [Bradyrhizobium sp. LHD-71]MDQ8732450.1 methyltransferase [Bradyrhizobium sp. LHD-71]
MRDPEDDRQALDLLIRGFQVSRTIRLVADLGIADRIAPDGAAPVAALANVCNVRPQQLMRVMRVLASFDVFLIDADGTIAHTPRSLLLRSDAPGSLHHAARFWTRPGSWRAWEALDAALHGANPHQVAWGTSRFAYLRDHPQEARIFDAFMAAFPDDRHAAVAACYDFSSARMIVDVGGGNGETLRRILARYPQAQGIVFDREDVVAAITDDARAEGRITTHGGSFLDTVPGGGDLYILCRVLHDWPDDQAVNILSACRAAMDMNARLLVVEGLLDPDPSRGEQLEYLLDMQMMAMFGTARERTFVEFNELLGAAGFAPATVIATPSSVSILEATPRA